MMKEKDVIDYFIKINHLFTLFNIFENELNHLKQTHPHIIDSWKYYKEFEKYTKINNHITYTKSIGSISALAF